MKPIVWLWIAVAIAATSITCGSEETGAVCGDGVRGPGEECDDGNTDDTDGCTSLCRLARCGDGLVRAGVEACDDGNLYDADACTSRCQPAACGDGVVQAGEECDDGNRDDHDGCKNDCTLAVCGDGVVRAGVEACDDGNTVDGDGCTSACGVPTCGNGILEPGEACDDGNLAADDACLPSCLEARCGDGFVRSGAEDCDDGNKDDHDGCKNDCKLAVCGDGVVHAGVEACDDGNKLDTDDCKSDCTLPSCGDGVVQPPEQCDDGNDSNTDGCLTSCLLAQCGDGFVYAGVEACDDGNLDPFDACDGACQLTLCGDGVVQPPEQCDDGNGSNEDGCLGNCTLAGCGDGFVWAGVEECDDGNKSNTDACTSQCKKASCGDGFVWAGVEGCDDGNTVDGDGCTPKCAPASCGDAAVQPPEQCDDGNLDNTDGCLMTCVAFDLCEGFAITDVVPPVACVGSSPPVLVLKASGHGFLEIEADKPSVKFDGQALAPALVTLSDCKELPGLLADVKSCTTMTIDIPDALGIGDYPIEVENPITQECPQSEVFSVAAPPTLTSVVPTKVCEGAVKLTLTGTNFAQATQVTLTDGAKTATPDGTTLVSSTTLEASFTKLDDGLYDVTVSNGPACSATLANAVDVLPTPFVFFVDPPVLYQGIKTRVIVYVTDINGGGVKAVRIRRSGTTDTPMSVPFTYDATKPNKIQVDIPAGLEATKWDLLVEDVETCEGLGLGVFEVTATLTLAVDRIEPGFGWTSAETPVRILAIDPPPAGKTSFQNLPRAFLNPSAGSTNPATQIEAGAFVSASEMTGVVPDGLLAGSYDVIVVNPDKTVGILLGAFKVVTAEPPGIDAISPGSVPTSPSAVDFDVIGTAFSTSPLAAVTLECRQPDNTTKNVTASVQTSSTSTRLVTKLPTNDIAAGSICIVRVTNPDGAFFDFSALGVTNPAEDLPGFTLATTSLGVARRALAATNGRPTRASRALYAIGGDNGAATAGNVRDTVETTALDRFGVPIGWRATATKLPQPVTLGRALTVGRFVYLAGGHSGSSRLNTLYRTEILSPTDVPEIDDLSLDLEASGLGAGIWYYRVSAVLTASDPDNPSGETLASDAQPVQIPLGLPSPVEVTIEWTAQPNAAKYRVYRTPLPNLASGAEELLGETTGQSFIDKGDATNPATKPLRLGDTGAWSQVATLGTQRESPGFTAARHPTASPAKWFLYVLGGRDAGGTALATNELHTVTFGAGGSQTVAGPTAGGTTFPPGRYEIGGLTVDRDVTTRVAADEIWIYALGGRDTNGLMVTDVDAAKVDLTTGALGSWQAVKNLNPSRAGYGHVAAANQLFVFGGPQGGPGNTTSSAQICGTGSGCPMVEAPPNLANWNAQAQLTTDRYLLATAIESGRIFVLGGVTTGGAALASVESTVW